MYTEIIFAKIGLTLSDVALVTDHVFTVSYNSIGEDLKLLF